MDFQESMHAFLSIQVAVDTLDLSNSQPVVSPASKRVLVFFFFSVVLYRSLVLSSWDSIRFFGNPHFTLNKYQKSTMTVLSDFLEAIKRPEKPVQG